jgi:hypothetical protein
MSGVLFAAILLALPMRAAAHRIALEWRSGGAVCEGGRPRRSGAIGRVRSSESSANR